MSDTQIADAPAAPLTLEDAILEAWSIHRRRPISDITAEEETVEKRIDQGIALYLLRTVASLSEKQVANKLGVDTLFVLRLGAELTRHRARNNALIQGRSNAIASAALERYKVGTRHVKKNIPLDEEKFTLAVDRAFGVFKADKSLLCTHLMTSNPLETWARSLVIALIYSVEQRGISQSRLADRLGTSINTVGSALTRVQKAVNNMHMCAFGTEIRKICVLYDINPIDLCSE